MNIQYNMNLYLYRGLPTGGFKNIHLFNHYINCDDQKKKQRLVKSSRKRFNLYSYMHIIAGLKSGVRPMIITKEQNQMGCMYGAGIKQKA